MNAKLTFEERAGILIAINSLIRENEQKLNWLEGLLKKGQQVQANIDYAMKENALMLRVKSKIMDSI